jgi:hypothetical protein
MRVWHNFPVTGKPSGEELRREAEQLRETATDLMEHAALLISKSVEFEKLILARGTPKPKK